MENISEMAERLSNGWADNAIKKCVMHDLIEMGYEQKFSVINEICDYIMTHSWYCVQPEVYCDDLKKAMGYNELAEHIKNKDAIW